MRINLYFLFFCLIVFISCSGPEKLSVYQGDQTIEVDGNLTNWNTNETLLKSTSEVDYYATTHDNNLYLFVDVKGIVKHSGILKSGIIVYLGSSEENRKRTGVAYPPGSYNLLRQYPNSFDSFTTDMEWSNKPANRKLLEDLQEDMYSSVLIVERPQGTNNAEYGFIDKSQLEVDGIEIAANQDRRYISIEMKVPLGETPLFDLSAEDIWLGFSIEPPDFNFREEASSVSNRQRDNFSNRSRREANMRYAISRNLGQGEDWFIINVK
ncbi:MAG: hypothetical protein U5K72_07445 [Balneolaceae bacterium]|nr:hypothetical protein [Balneolaceae bacterium]